MPDYHRSLWIAKLTLVLLALLLAISGFWVSRDSPSWAGRIGAMIPAAGTLYMAYRVGRPTNTKCTTTQERSS